MNLLPRLLPAAVLALVLLGSARAEPQPVAPVVVGGYIQDDAGLFSPSALNDANLRIAELYDKTKVGLYVRTLKAVPDEVIEALKNKTQAQALAEANNFARELAEKAGIRRAVYVLFSNDPRSKFAAVVAVPHDELKNLFPDHAATAVRNLFIRRNFGEQPNTVLLQAVEKVEYQLLNRSEATSISWLLLGAIIAGLLGLWLLLVVVRMQLSHPAPGQAETPARRTSLLAGMLGGMFGGTAGHWIYDTLFAPSSGERTATPTEAVSSSAEGDQVDDTA